jgi:hypothetical protein
MNTRQLRALGSHDDHFGATLRNDAYWVGPLLTACGLLLFFGYLTFRAFQGTYVWCEPYVSPTVAPPLLTPASGYPGAVPVAHAWLGAFPAWWPSFIPQSPAFFIPGLAIAFRATCYYYRKAYYRAFAFSPPACAVRGVPRPYRGETGLLIFQNLHRYALYGALFLLVCLWHEAIGAFFKHGRFGIGVGTLIMIVNASLLSGYTFGCHSFRHLIGGRSDCLACGQATLSYRAWKGASWFNGKHMQWAWASLVWVVFTDLYVQLVSRGVLTDLNTWGS